MVRIFAISIFCFYAAAAVAASAITADGEIQLRPEAQRALDLYDRNFKVFAATDFAPTVRDFFGQHEAPMAAAGDFNSDGREDVVLMGASRGKQVVLALVTAPSGYRVSLLHQTSLLNPKTAKYGEETGYSHYIAKTALRWQGRKIQAIQLESVLALNGTLVFAWDGKAFSVLN